jgi:glutaredoxin-related protein
MIILYSTGCPKCNILKKKLDLKDINYETVTDINIMQAKGFDLMPVLQVGSRVFDFKSAVDWINQQ